jgi:NADPH-dependent ferric siderophore reductase
MPHETTYVRHELVQRNLRVRSTTRLTPGLLRIVLAGEALAGFISLAPDDHVKAFFPAADGDPERRDYTVRRFDPVEGTLTLEFALHPEGPGTRWAQSAAPGAPLTVGGPKKSRIIAPDYDWWLLIGDECALPAMGRRIEETAAGIRVISLAAVPGPEHELGFTTAGELQALWVHRPAEAADDPAPLLAALARLPLPPGDGFVWIAGETRMVKAVAAHMTDVAGHPAAAMKASGYWVKGQAKGQSEPQPGP